MPALEHTDRRDTQPGEFRQLTLVEVRTDSLTANLLAYFDCEFRLSQASRISGVAKVITAPH